eukprot:CAMPEP_0184310328 /NCGR_PEP_ID=MMETSP1049-20130417/26818_1 /TAXON_ID=77928 /ORGANISM="Proteomonas sulcata, Strain CCMP704" /LENGTH=229 /DNA_ID=CAMNT_0026624253 /DNA_START=14 /DNA_END=703 /DNA_ORIENTATION=+
MPTTGYTMPTYTAPANDRVVTTENVVTPMQQTVMVPQTTYQNRTIQVPQVSTVQVPTQYMETYEQAYQVPKYEQVPYQYQVPRTYTVMETMTAYQQRPVYQQKSRTVQVPRTYYENVEVPYTEQVYETRTQPVQVPRTAYTQQPVTTMATQTVQEPVTYQVPMTQTVQAVQQVNRVVEYARTPVNQYVVPGATTYGAAMPYTGYGGYAGYGTISQPAGTSGSAAPQTNV